jgi:hypothetical protein
VDVDERHRSRELRNPVRGSVLDALGTPTGVIQESRVRLERDSMNEVDVLRLDDH